MGHQPAGRQEQARFREKFGLPFTLLADEDHEVAEAYGSWVEKQNYGKTYWGTARTTFLVDPDGRIARTWPKVKPEGHAADVLAALDELQARPRMTRTWFAPKMKLRSWGETSEASAGRLRAGTPAATVSTHGADDRMIDDRPQHAHGWRPARSWSSPAIPDDADFGPAATAARWIAEGSDGLAGVLHERRPGRRGPGPRPARAGRACARRSSGRGRR